MYTIITECVQLNEQEEDSALKRITRWKPQGSRSEGRSKTRWEDQIVRDVRSAGIRNGGRK